MKKLLFFVFLSFTFLAYGQIMIGDIDTRYGETHIAINPTNPNNLIGTAIAFQASLGTPRHIALYTTIDGGDNWIANETFSEVGGADPVVAFDNDGIAYCLYQIRDNLSLYLSTSDNGGISWTTPIAIISDVSNVDRPWMAVSPRRNQDGNFNIYVSYTINTPDYTVALQRSEDGGVNFTTIYDNVGDPNSQFWGTHVAVNQNEGLIFAWTEHDLPGWNVTKIWVISSVDAGVNFSDPYDMPVYQIGTKTEGERYRLKNVLVDCFPRTIADNISGDFYITWASKYDELSNDNSNIYISRGTKINNEIQWSARTPVDTEEGIQFDPAIGISPSGKISILYYSSPSHYPETPLYLFTKHADSYGALGGADKYTMGFPEGFFVVSGDFVGDYQGIACGYDIAHTLYVQRIGSSPNKIQVYCQNVGFIPKPPIYGFIVADLDQKNMSGETIGQISKWDTDRFVSYSVPNKLVIETSSTEILEADTNLVSIQKYQQWSDYIEQKSILNFEQFIVPLENTQYISNFNNVKSTVLKTNVAISEINTIQFKDPWLRDYTDPTYGVRNQGMNAPFKSYNCDPEYVIFNTSGSTHEGVFLDLEPDPLNPEKPYYSIKAAFVKYVGNNFFVFDSFIFDPLKISEYTDERFPNDPNIRAIEFKSDNAEITALYHQNILTENSTIYYNGAGEVRIKADEYLADTEAIYQFSHWNSSDPGKVNFYSPNNNNTEIEISGSDFSITPVYDNVFELAVPPSEIVISQDLEIPAGAYYEIPPMMTFKINLGNLKINGTANQPIILDVGEPPLLKRSSGLDTWPGIRLLGGTLEINHAVIKNTDTGVEATAGVCEINNTVFDNSDLCIKANMDLTSDGPVRIHNCTFVNSTKGVEWHDLDIPPTESNYLDLRNCIFYNNTDLDIHMYTNYRAYSCDTVSYNRFYPYKGSQSSHFMITPSSASDCVYENNNIYGTDPLFRDAENGDYHLTWGSPCIDQGDPNLPNDSDGTRSDIGAYFYPQVGSGNISTNTIWSGDLRILGDITLDQGIELTILPGTNIFMSPDVTINVNGKFTAIGTSEDPIKFTSIYESPGTSQYWDRIRFNDSADNSSILDHCTVEYNDFGVQTLYADITVKNSEIKDIRYYGIYGYKSDLNIYDNHIHDIGYNGIYLNRNNYISGQTYISGNHIEDAQRGIYLYRSSPKLYDNEIYDCDYGLYCLYYSSANLGWIDQGGYNYLHHNGRGVYSYKSSPFLGQNMCTINGGYNKIENSSVYQVEAKSYSNILAEKNWWASGYNFYQDGTSIIDYIPYLSQPPFSKITSNSPQESAFNNAFAKITSGDTAITDKEVMESYD